MNSKYFSADEILKIPEEDLPLMVLSDNMLSFISFGIKAREAGMYNHFMWMHKPGQFLSQGLWLKEENVEKYLSGRHRLKFWTNKGWTGDEKSLLREVLREKAARPWYQTLYDPIQIIGKLLGISWLQIPGVVICSDHIDYISVVDKFWQTQRHLSPPEINKLLKWNSDYACYGRYMLD